MLQIEVATILETAKQEVEKMILGEHATKTRPDTVVVASKTP